ncbi:hypothetical protein ACVI1J_007863 [Bradyrhizobium diazoefficiens]
MKTLRQLLTGEDVIQLVIRLGLLALLIFWTLYLIRPFVTILVWALVLAVAFNPIFLVLAKILGGRAKLAAGLLTAINLAIVIGPAAWLGLGAVDGIRDFAGELAAGDLVIPSPPAAIKTWPLIGTPLYEFWDQASTNLRSVVQRIAPYLKPFAGTLLGIAGDAGVGTIKFLLSVVVAGCLFPYGPQLVAAGRSFLSRIVPEQSEHFLDLAGATIRAVAQGVIGIAVVQALLAGIGFKLAGIPIARLACAPGAVALHRADRRSHHHAPRDDLDLDRQGCHCRSAADIVPRNRQHSRQHTETVGDGTRPDDAGARHPDRRDRRNAGPRNSRPFHRTYCPVGGLGAHRGLDQDRSRQRGVAGDHRPLT